MSDERNSIKCGTCHTELVRQAADLVAPCPKCANGVSGRGGSADHRTCEKHGVPLIHTITEETLCAVCERSHRNAAIAEKERAEKSADVWQGLFDAEACRAGEAELALGEMREKWELFKGREDYGESWMAFYECATRNLSHHPTPATYEELVRLREARRIWGQAEVQMAPPERPGEMLVYLTDDDFKELDAALAPPAAAGSNKNEMG